jgi:DNA-binding response OmpR family regulator
MEPCAIKVLIIDDNPDDSRIAGKFLERYPHAGFEVSVADRLSRAFSHLDRGHFDAILLDLNLPDSHGLETLIRARLHASQSPIIILSGNAAKRLREGAIELGASSYMVKEEDQYYALAASIHAMVKARREGSEEAMLRAN